MIEKTYPIAKKLISKCLLLNNKLFDLLTREAENLRNKTSPETIASLANSKKETVNQLEQFSKQMSQILSTENLQFDQTGIHEYLEKAQSSGFQVAETLNQWKKITELSASCRSINEQNGASIALLIHHGKRTLEILRGKPQLSSTYGPDGSKKSDRFGQTLISV